MADTHDDLRELAAGYVLGALGADERRRFEAHLAACDECAAEVRSLGPVVAGLAEAVPYREAPAYLRQRVLAIAGGGAGPARPADIPPGAVLHDVPSRAPVWMAVAASIAALVVAGYSLQLRGRVETLEGRLRDAETRATEAQAGLAVAERAAARAHTTLAVLAAPDLARVELTSQPMAATARGRAFWSRSRGLVFTAANLPPLPVGRTYQLWIVTAQAPISAGLLTPDASGSVTAMFDTPSDVAEPVAMAVTLEPEGGVASPTGDKVLVGLLTQ
jgi:anti-sigma-K factor RskA